MNLLNTTILKDNNLIQKITQLILHQKILKLDLIKYLRKFVKRIELTTKYNIEFLEKLF